MNLKTNINELDNIIGGLNSKELITIASRPSMGKSTLALNIINNVSKEVKDKILYFNLETSKERLKEVISSDNIEIIDTPNISIEDIKSKCEEISKNGLALVVIDYLQLIHTTINDNSYIIRTLKLLANELNIPIIILSQLSRPLEERENKRPILEDLSKNSSILQDLDKVIFLYRDSYYNKDYELKDMEIIIAKNSFNSLGTIKVLHEELEK